MIISLKDNFLVHVIPLEPRPRLNYVPGVFDLHYMIYKEDTMLRARSKDVASRIYQSLSRVVFLR